MSRKTRHRVKFGHENMDERGNVIDISEIVEVQYLDGWTVQGPIKNDVRQFRYCAIPEQTLTSAMFGWLNLRLSEIEPTSEGAIRLDANDRDLLAEPTGSLEPIRFCKLFVFDNKLYYQ